MPLLSGMFERRSFSTLEGMLKLARREMGRDVSVDSALTLTAVFRSAAIISGTVGGLPLKTYQNDENGRLRSLLARMDQESDQLQSEGLPESSVRSLVMERHGDDLQTLLNATLETDYSSRNHETTVRVVKRPNPAMTGNELREIQTAHLVLWGNSYSWKVRDRSNRVRELWPIYPDTVKPIVSNGEKMFEVRPRMGEPMLATSREILHIPGFGYDGVKGLSPIGVARENISEALAARKFSGSLFNSGAIAAGLITTTKKLQKEQAEGIKQRWKDTVGSVEGAADIGILDQGFKFEKLSIDPQDLQFLETREFGVVEIARLYGIPPHLLGDVERSTSWGTGIQEQTTGFVMFTIQPGYLTRIEKRYSWEVTPAGQFAEFKIDGLLRGSAKDRAEVYEKALDKETGWMDRSEVRQLENLPVEVEEPQDVPEEIPGEPAQDVEENWLAMPATSPKRTQPETGIPNVEEKNPWRNSTA